MSRLVFVVLFLSMVTNTNAQWINRIGKILKENGSDIYHNIKGSYKYAFPDEPKETAYILSVREGALSLAKGKGYSNLQSYGQSIVMSDFELSDEHKKSEYNTLLKARDRKDLILYKGKEAEDVLTELPWNFINNIRMFDSIPNYSSSNLSVALTNGRVYTSYKNELLEVAYSQNMFVCYSRCNFDNPFLDLPKANSKYYIEDRMLYETDSLGRVFHVNGNIGSIYWKSTYTKGNKYTSYLLSRNDYFKEIFIMPYFLCGVSENINRVIVSETFRTDSQWGDGPTWNDMEKWLWTQVAEKSNDMEYDVSLHYCDDSRLLLFIEMKLTSNDKTDTYYFIEPTKRHLLK